LEFSEQHLPDSRYKVQAGRSHQCEVFHQGREVALGGEKDCAAAAQRSIQDVLPASGAVVASSIGRWRPSPRIGASAIRHRPCSDGSATLCQRHGYAPCSSPARN
jgi:hypothetical protein